MRLDVNGGLAEEYNICGRPLGFEIDETKNVMYVADAYLGIWRVDLRNDNKEMLVSPHIPINGKTPKLFNSVALDKNDGLYWTDSSTEYHLNDGVFASISDPSGRLIYYNFSTKENKVLIDNLWFPNGIIISPDHSFIVIAETFKYRLLKYYINGPKVGTTEVFIGGLPGTPDILRVLPDGSGFQVALYYAFDGNKPLISKRIAPLPLIRKVIIRIFRLTELLFEFLNSVFPHYIFEEIVYKVGTFGSAGMFSPGVSGIILADWSGNIFAAYYNSDGSVSHISDAIVYNDTLLIGSPSAQYIGAVPAPDLLKKAYLSKDVNISEKESKTNE
ncbi:adipocyte plasma membrane-associated protein Hemomucin-like [Leptidea sinapis]|uniref:adipocyte plasma membrane-associated protein Hemomucin-like n=1 Tax=Leptidea sinapis TaxID=189913 RepID=UPI0021C29C45|nr:adipocyte plasma membrane-associated protein Hemomucin-like [Leptidea sinapis]